MNRIDFSQFDLQGITLQDFEFMQATAKDAVGGLSAILGVNYVVTGCDITVAGGTPVTGNVTAGYVVIDNEVLKVDAHSFSVPTIGDLKWKVEETVTAPSPSLFADSSLRDVHFQRRAIIDQAGSVSLFVMFKAAELIYNIAQPSNAPVALVLSPEWEPGATPTMNPSFRIDGRICHFMGDVRYKASSPPTPTIPYVSQLPGIVPRPLTTIVRQVIACDWDVINDVPINITNSWVKITPLGIITAPHDTGKSLLLNFSYPIN